MAGVDILRPRRWRPPDPEKASAAKVRQDQSGGRGFSATGTAGKYIDGGFYSSRPQIVVRPYAGAFSATYLKRTDGTEQRLQIFPHPHAGTRCAKLLNAAIAECRL